MLRVARNDDPEIYQDTGRRAAERVRQAMIMHAERPVVDVLDWGCGPGRIAAWIARWRPPVKLHGCDVDAEAADWAQEHIDGEFITSPLVPPLPYDDRSFDAIVAISVFTHLNRRRQRIWLRDLARVLRPGGLLVASVHGETAARAFGVPGISGGMDDKYLDTAMAGVLPDRYYGVTLQTEQFTRNAWSERFNVVAWEEAALDTHDLVVCRKAGDLA